MAQPNPAEDLKFAVENARRELIDYLDTRFTEEISAVKWPWPVPPSVRDVVDTGRLRASVVRSNTGQGATFTWPVEYAAQVHDGGVAIDGNQRFPGRPWTKEPLEEVPAQFETLMQAALDEIGFDK